jgi:Uncharacterised nucleotidyltransferase
MVRSQPATARPIISLLQAISQGRGDVRLSAFDVPTTHWAVETGFGPLLYRATKADDGATTSSLWPLLQSADLTARMISAEQLDAMCEILDACAGSVHPVTLLKGISICDQHYPEPHLRPMRDLDFLIDEATMPVVEAFLGKLGYRQRSNKSAELYKYHHHSMPWFHPRRGVWVEVHRGLFPPRSLASADEVFSLKHVKTQLQPSTLCGRTVTRLSDELQLVYIAAHWAREFRVVGGMVAMSDIIYLLKNRQATLHWEEILGWMRNAVASTYLYLLLSYLDRYKLIAIDPYILHELRRCQRPLGSTTLKIMYALIDRYFVNGRALGLVFSLRTCDILWRTLLLPGPPWRNLLLFACNMALPLRLRRKFLA